MHRLLRRLSTYQLRIKVAQSQIIQATSTPLKRIYLKVKEALDMTEASQRRFIWPSQTITWQNLSTWLRKARINVQVTLRVWSMSTIRRQKVMLAIILLRYTPPVRLKSRHAVRSPPRHQKLALTSNVATYNPSIQSIQIIRSRHFWWRTPVAKLSKPRKCSNESKTELKRWSEPGKKHLTSPWKRLPSWF